MPLNDPKIKCYVIVTSDKEFDPVMDAMKAVSKEVNARLISSKKITPLLLEDSVYSEITKVDLVIAEISQPKPDIFYEIGLARAMGKPIIFLIQRDTAAITIPIRRGQTLSYATTPDGLSEFRNEFMALLKAFIRSPQRFRPPSLFPATFVPPLYIIDLEKLEPREFENLCFELITQMGFRRVEWGKELREIDAVATLSKKDPDGYEYQELWLISMGRHAQVEDMLEIAVQHPEYFIHRLLSPGDLEELLSKHRIRYDVPITILFILQKPPPEMLEPELRRLERRQKERPYPFTIRVRYWDPQNLTKLIQQYPQIAFKYFSEVARVKSKYRKTPEELYEENVKLTDDLLLVKKLLEDEKQKRFIAERDAAWKDVAFKAAHKLGNPIDAIDTYLQGLKRRIQDNRISDALNTANDMDVSIEEAKTVISQFKSLTKSQEIKPQPVDVIPLIQHACNIAQENGVSVDIQIIKNLPQVMVDPEKMAECFNELVSNALHWFDKSDKKIIVKIDKISKTDLPEGLNREHQYLKVDFEDNGRGVPFENKEKIFSPFYTTDPHGTGLGLSLVKWIIEVHGGQIREIGKPGEGANFEMYLPLAKKSKKE